MLILLYKRTDIGLQASTVAGLFRVLRADSQQVKQVSWMPDYLVMLVTLVKYYKYNCFKHFYNETVSLVLAEGRSIIIIE